MTKNIQIRNVPDELHRTRKARAAMAGMCLSDSLMDCTRRLADLPLERYPPSLLVAHIWSYRDNLTACDATYPVLADALDCPVWTRDAGFAKAPPPIDRVRLI